MFPFCVYDIYLMMVDLDCRNMLQLNVCQVAQS